MKPLESSGNCILELFCYWRTFEIPFAFFFQAREKWETNDSHYLTLLLTKILWGWWDSLGHWDLDEHGGNFRSRTNALILSTFEIKIKKGNKDHILKRLLKVIKKKSGKAGSCLLQRVAKNAPKLISPKEFTFAYKMYEKCGQTLISFPTPGGSKEFPFFGLGWNLIKKKKKKEESGKKLALVSFEIRGRAGCLGGFLVVFFFFGMCFWFF